MRGVGNCFAMLSDGIREQITRGMRAGPEKRILIHTFFLIPGVSLVLLLSLPLLLLIFSHLSLDFPSIPSCRLQHDYWICLEEAIYIELGRRRKCVFLERESSKCPLWSVDARNWSKMWGRWGREAPLGSGSGSDGVPWVSFRMFVEDHWDPRRALLFTLGLL